MNCRSKYYAKKVTHNGETFDSKTFRKDHPDLYDEYVSISMVKASVRMKVVSE